MHQHYNSFLLSVGGSFTALEALNPSSTTMALLISTFASVSIQIAKLWIEKAYAKRVENKRIRKADKDFQHN